MCKKKKHKKRLKAAGLITVMILKSELGNKDKKKQEIDADDINKTVLSKS